METTKKGVLNIYDLPTFVFMAGIISLFLIPSTYNGYINLNKNFPVLLSFLKFALLATFGEMLVLRIKTGKYCMKSFGLIPKMIIWGFLGIFIWLAFLIFSNGVSRGFYSQIESSSVFIKILKAFSISFFMNLIFAPVMMLIHHLTDLHIARNNGKFPIKTFYPLVLLENADWNKMWGFVFKKTIPLFWIPAHTITFLLPEDFRVLFAAGLSVILGLLLSVKSSK